MADLVDIALPAAAQTAAETLGLTVHRSVTSGARVRDIPRDEAELAIEYLREWGFAARILERTSGDEPGTARVA
jgi:cation transport ATPase